MKNQKTIKNKSGGFTNAMVDALGDNQTEQVTLANAFLDKIRATCPDKHPVDVVQFMCHPASRDLGDKLASMSGEATCDKILKNIDNLTAAEINRYWKYFADEYK